MNPWYESGNQHRELADLLLILNDACIVLSVKGTDGTPKSNERLRLWLSKKTWDGSKAAKTAAQRLARVNIAAKNLWDEERTFPAGSLKPVCGIALLECSQEPYKPIEFAPRQPKSGMPIHFLSLNDFLNVVTLLGSIWDVFHYFEQRQTVLETFTGINQERPILAYYTLRSPDLKGVLVADKQRLCDLHQLHMLENIPSYSERDRLSGYVNAVVHELHERHPEMESFVPPELRSSVEPKDRRSAYLQMAAMLNSLPSSNKAWIGRRIESLLETAKQSGTGGCFGYKRFRSEPVFVFAVFSKLSRTERTRALHRLLQAGLCRYGTSEGLGVAYTAQGEADSGFDIEWIRGMKTFSDETHKLGEECFPAVEALHATPFGEARPYTPKNSTG